MNRKKSVETEVGGFGRERGDELVRGCAAVQVVARSARSLSASSALSPPSAGTNWRANLRARATCSGSSMWSARSTIEPSGCRARPNGSPTTMRSKGGSRPGLLAPRPWSADRALQSLCRCATFGLPPRDSQAGKSASGRSDDAAKSSNCSDAAVMPAAADASIRPWTSVDLPAPDVPLTATTNGVDAGRVAFNYRGIYQHPRISRFLDRAPHPLCTPPVEPTWGLPLRGAARDGRLRGPESACRT